MGTRFYTNFAKREITMSNETPTQQMENLSRNKLESALLEARKEFKEVQISGTGAFDNPYATKHDLMVAVNEALIKFGLNYHFSQKFPSHAVQGVVYFVFELIHAESGQRKQWEISIPLPKADVWSYGSAMTYGFRYIFSDVLCLPVEVNPADDDGTSAQKSAVRKERATIKAVNNDI
jgi:hypothetical protein